VRACGEVLGKAKLDSAAINPAPLSAARPIVFRKLDPIDTFNNDPHTTLDDVKLVLMCSAPSPPFRFQSRRLGEDCSACIACIGQRLCCGA